MYNSLHTLQSIGAKKNENRRRFQINGTTRCLENERLRTESQRYKMITNMARLELFFRKKIYFHPNSTLVP